MRRIIRFGKRVKNRMSMYVNLIRLKMHGVIHGKHCVIHGKLYIHLFPTAEVKIGNNFYCSSGNCINALSTNRRGCIYATKDANITIGDHVGMSSTVLWAINSITIGNYVKIGADCLLLDTDSHSLDYLMRRGQYTDWGIAKPIVIEDDVLIGARCIILKGCTIGARSIVAAGSVVTKSFPSDCLIGGNPAKLIKKFDVV